MIVHRPFLMICDLEREVHVGVVFIATAIPRQVSLRTLPNLLSAVTCLIFGHQTKDECIIMDLTNNINIKYIMSGFGHNFP